MRMTLYKRFSPGIFSALWLTILFVTWIAFAPTQAGGLASYIIIIGNSMEPKFHIGDLVVIHEEAAYKNGDAVAYQNSQLNSFVFHRITSQEMGRFTLKGDNNTWTDTYQPTRKEVIGKLWLHIPRGGIFIQKIRNPIIMALIAGILGIIVVSTLFPQTKDKRRMNNKPFRKWFNLLRRKFSDGAVHNGGRQPQEPSANKAVLNWGAFTENSFFLLGLIALISLILATIAFSRPAASVTNDDIPYEHLGFFSYSAPAPQGVYDANSIQSGEPIFPKLTCTIDVGFQYTFVAAQTDNITGTYQLTAIISEPVSGWKRTVPLQKEAAFSGNLFDTKAHLNLCEIEAMTQSMELSTDFHPGSYALEIRPNVKVTGQISGEELQTTFNSGLVFLYDRAHFHIAHEEDDVDPLSPVASSILRAQHMQASTLTLLGVKVEVPALRLFSILCLGLSILGMVLLGLKIQDLTRRDPTSLIRMRYESIMVDVQNIDLRPSANIVDVTSVDHLAKLAERYNAMILHEAKEHVHAYYLQAEGTTYRFATTTDKAGSEFPEQEAIHQEDKS